ncbi:MAG: hypothetical protein ABJN75_04450 [Hoeflea sp.]|uniref:hypothetical protein n=1 Tax=Hoeflea sp. TaxID=1940281 RepID=UPI00329A6FD2
MFKITKANDLEGFGAPPKGFVTPDPELVSHYCRIESWTANLATGVFFIGPAARHHHGLPDEGDFGLLNLVQCYDAPCRHQVLELYEVAATSPSSFCFSTTIIHEDGSHSPVLCTGQSSNFSDDGDGSINGIFIFPKFKLDRNKPSHNH